MAMRVVQVVGAVGTVIHHMTLQDQTILCQRYWNESAIHVL